MSNLSPDILVELEKEYILNYLDQEQEPDLREFAAKHDTPYMLLKKAHTHRNWSRKWKRNRQEFLGKKNQAISKQIEVRAFDLAKVQGELMSTTLDIVMKDLPKVRALLMERIEDMSDKEMIQAYKLLLDLSGNAQNLLNKVGKELQEQNKESVPVNPAAHNLGLSAKIVDIVQRAQMDKQNLDHDTKQEVTVLTELEQDELEAEKNELFEKLNG